MSCGICDRRSHDRGWQWQGSIYAAKPGCVPCRCRSAGRRTQPALDQRISGRRPHGGSGLKSENDTQTDLSRFSVGEYRAGPRLKVFAWYFVNYYVFDSSWPWPYSFKRGLLRVFGAKVGCGLVIKPRVRIKNPWRLTIGAHCWVGESVWIDNLEDVSIGSNVSLSQGSMLLTGNHDYTRHDFPYRLGKIVLGDGVWIGAKAVVCPGVTCGSHAILTVNSVATKDMAAWSIYSGNPAQFQRKRVMNSPSADDAVSG